MAYRLRDAPDTETAAQQVAEYLNHVERDFMDELTRERKRANHHLAAQLVAWHEWSRSRSTNP